jgi:hypothetical protein
MRLFLAFLVGLAASLSAQDAGATDPAPPAGIAAARPALVEGFRSTRFGMSESEVRDAIRRDFALPDRDIAAAANPDERTTSLVVKVINLLPEMPPGAVSYVFGAKSKRLIQVNLGWGLAETGPVTLEVLVPAANALRDYFLRSGAYGKGSVANQQYPDGSILVFRGIDDKGRMVVVLLRPQEEPADKTEKADKAKADPVDRRKLPGMLLISYVESPNSPDVFRIEPGKF